MIRLQRSYDYELIRSIITHPRVYSSIASDFHPTASDFSPNESASITYLLATDEVGSVLGVCIGHWIHTPLTWEIHHALLPPWRRTDEIIRSFETWLFSETSCRTAIGFTPVCNTLACRFALRNGMKEAGRIPNAYQKNGKLFDMVLFIKQKP